MRRLGSGFDEYVGDNVRRLRLARGLTQAALADQMARAGVEMSQQVVAKVEKGARPLRLVEAVALADLFDVHVQDLVDDQAIPDSSYIRETTQWLAEAWERLREAAGDTYLSHFLLSRQVQRAEAGDASVPSVVLESSRIDLGSYWPSRALEAGRRHAIGKALELEETPTSGEDIMNPVLHGGHSLADPMLQNRVDLFLAREVEADGVDQEA